MLTAQRASENVYPPAVTLSSHPPYRRARGNARPACSAPPRQSPGRFPVDVKEAKFLIRVDGRVCACYPEQEALRQRVVGVDQQKNSARKSRRNTKFFLQEFKNRVSLLKTQQVISADRLGRSQPGPDIVFNKDFIPAVLVDLREAGSRSFAYSLKKFTNSGVARIVQAA